MGLFKKAEDAIRANLNDLLDKATDPLKQLNLMIDDMKDFRAKQPDLIQAAITEKKIIEADLQEAIGSVASWTRRAEKAKTDEDAKLALKNQIQQEGLAKTLTGAQEDAQKKIEHLKMELKELDGRIEWLESQRDVVAVRVKTAVAETKIHGTGSAHGHMPDANEVLGKVGEKVKRMEAEASAGDEVSELRTPQRAEDRFKESELDDEVERRLADLKAKKAQ